MNFISSLKIRTAILAAITCLTLIAPQMAQAPDMTSDLFNLPGESPTAELLSEPCLDDFDVPLTEFYRKQTGDMQVSCAAVGSQAVGTASEPPVVTVTVDGTPLEAWVYWLGETRSVDGTNGVADQSVTMEKLVGGAVVDTREIEGVEVGRRTQLFSDETSAGCAGNGGEVVMRGLVPLDMLTQGDNTFRLPKNNCLSCFNEKAIFCNGADREIYRRQYGFAVEIVVDGGGSGNTEVIALEGGDYASRGPNSGQPECDPAQTMTELTCFDFEALDCDASAQLSFIIGGVTIRENSNGDLASQEETLFGSSSGMVGPGDLSQIELNQLINEDAFYRGQNMALYNGPQMLREGDTQACFKVNLLPREGERFPQSVILAKATLTIDRTCPAPEPAALGDRVWEDFDGDGVQDCTDTNGNGLLGDPGDIGPECLSAAVSGVPVELFTPDDMGNCVSPTGRTTVTDADGFYLFDDLAAGDYCVQFDIGGLDSFCDTDTFELGAPTFTKQNIGDDAADSDASTTDGTTDSVSLLAGDLNRTLDAGLVCPVKLGDRVWNDENGNGLQDDGESNVSGVTVRLFECGPDGMPNTADDVDTGETRITSDEGRYMFGAEPGFALPPGDYFVQFDESTLPSGSEFTSPKQGGDDGIDSDCLVPGGRTACTDLNDSRTVNLNRDCGIVTQACDLRLDKTCRVEPQPTNMPGEKCNGRLQEFTLIWNGAGDIEVTVLNGSSTSADGSIVSPGDEVTVFGPFSDNDVVLDITGSVTGQSEFHTSCSDENFNSPDDCGKAAGNGKSDEASLINDWLLEGFVDADGSVLDCTTDPSGGEFTDDCTFTPQPRPSCETTGKPETLTWHYDGGTGGDGDCADSTFASFTDSEGDMHDDFVCTGLVDAGLAVTVNDDQGGSRMVSPGEEFTLSLDASKQLDLSNAGGDQHLEFHTSCSQPIEVGLTAGALTLVAMDGNTGTTTVTYQFVVTNEGGGLTGIELTDTELGCIAGADASCNEDAFDLGTGESQTFTAQAELADTTTNSATASAGGTCTASDTVTVEAVAPSCAVAAEFYDVSDDAIKYKLTNSSDTTATLETLVLDFPATLGSIREVKLDGAIYKSDESSLDVTPGVTIGPDDWTEVDVSKRVLEPGETRTLEVKFTSKDSQSNWVGESDLGLTTYAEACDAPLGPVPPCEAGKPTELVFDYTGDDCSATTQNQEGKFVCTETGTLGALVDVVMTKDADKFAVEIDGNRIRIYRSDNPGDSFPSEIEYRIDGTTGTQSHILHTSCSKALNFGDQFGALVLTGFVPDSFIEPPAPAPLFGDSKLGAPAP